MIAASKINNNPAPIAACKCVIRGIAKVFASVVYLDDTNLKVLQRFTKTRDCPCPRHYSLAISGNSFQLTRSPLTCCSQTYHKKPVAASCNGFNIKIGLDYLIGCMTSSVMLMVTFSPRPPPSPMPNCVRLITALPSKPPTLNLPQSPISFASIPM